MSALDKTYAEVAGPYYKTYEDRTVGIELELECPDQIETGSTLTSHTDLWCVHGEDSLRGGFELVLTRPLTTDSRLYRSAIHHLSKFLETQGPYLVTSPRTSLHVHVNIQHKTLRQIYNIILNTYLFENFLSYNSSANRKGNLFCVRGCDAEAGLYLLGNSVQSGHLHFKKMYNDGFKYGALNMASIAVHGTVEFRFMDAYLDASMIDWYTKCLEEFVERASKINPRAYINALRTDSLDVKKELKKIMGEEGFQFFCSNINFSNTSTNEMVTDNVLGVIHVLDSLSNVGIKSQKFRVIGDDGMVVVDSQPAEGLINSLPDDSAGDDYEFDDYPEEFDD